MQQCIQVENCGSVTHVSFQKHMSLLRHHVHHNKDKLLYCNSCGRDLYVRTLHSLIYFNICHRNHLLVCLVVRDMHSQRPCRPIYTSTLAKNYSVVQTVTGALLQLQFPDNTHFMFIPFRNQRCQTDKLRECIC
jgi:hypothetical protein